MGKWQLQEWWFSWSLFGFGVINHKKRGGWDFDELEIQIAFWRFIYLKEGGL
jgi:hypothetical protein